MQLCVGKRRAVRLPPRACEADEVRRLVDRENRPFVVFVDHPSKASFKAQGRVFINTERGARVECETEEELWFACRLVAEVCALFFLKFFLILNEFSSGAQHCPPR